MQVQSADLHQYARVKRNPQTRILSLGIAGAIHVAIIYALIAAMVPGARVHLPGDVHLLPTPEAPPPKPEPQPRSDIERTFVNPNLPTVRPPDWATQHETGNTITVIAGVEKHVDALPPSPAQGLMGTHTIPPYPEIAIRLQEHGTVILRLAVAADGSVGDAQVETSSGSTTLDDAAVAWVKTHWRYRPATRDGVAVASTMQAAVRFDLKNAR